MVCDTNNIKQVVKSHTEPFQPIGGQVDKATVTETVDSGSIPGRVKPKIIKIGIHSFPV